MNEYLKKSVLIAMLSCPAFGMTEFFVSTQGQDINPGTAAHPFATLQRARDAVRAVKQQSGQPWQGATVWVEPGTYYLSEPLELTGQDSGTEIAPVIYRTRPGHEVRLVGGKSVTDFGPVADIEILARLPESARKHVLCADLKAQGVTDFGEVAAQGRRLELFFEDKAMQLARWPNEGFVRVVDVKGETPMTTHGIKGTREGRLVYAEDRPSAWVAEPDVWLHGYWFWDWSDAFERVADIDPVKKIISTTAPYHNYGYRKGQRYYALNVLAELDRPGEWYLDRDTGTLYFWPPRDVPDVTVVLSELPSLFALKDCSWVTLRGFVLEATRATAVTVSGGRSNRVQGCVIRNIGAWAVRISGGKQHAVLGCDIYDVGEGGVSLSGGDRRTLTAAGHLAENNHIHHFGRIYRTYRPGVAVGGVGNRVRHNVIHDGPHNAIQLGGNDHLIEFNEIHHVCFETGDVGAFYMGRDWTARGTMILHNYFHHIQGPGLHGAMAVYLDDSASGISIVGNLFHKAGRAAFIGGGRDNLVENNVFVDCPASVHVDARGVGWMKYHVDEGGTLPTRLEAMPYKQSPWKETYPQLLTLLDDDPGLPKGNVVSHNISYGGKWLDVESKAMPLIRFEGNLVDEDPRFVDLEQGDFRLKPDSPALALGFKPIPIDEIGLYAHENRASKKE